MLPHHHQAYEIPRGPQQGEILDAGAEIRDPKSQLAIFSDYFRKIKRSCKILRDLSEILKSL